METVTTITALLIAAGTVLTAIYNARGKSEKTLQEHIEKLEKRFDELQVKYDILTRNYDDLLKKYVAEKARGDILEAKIAELTTAKRKRKSK